MNGSVPLDVLQAEQQLRDDYERQKAQGVGSATHQSFADWVWTWRLEMLDGQKLHRMVEAQKEAIYRSRVEELAEHFKELPGHVNTAHDESRSCGICIGYTAWAVDWMFLVSNADLHHLFNDAVAKAIQESPAVVAEAEAARTALAKKYGQQSIHVEHWTKLLGSKVSLLSSAPEAPTTPVPVETPPDIPMEPEIDEEPEP